MILNPLRTIVLQCRVYCILEKFVARNSLDNKGPSSSNTPQKRAPAMTDCIDLLSMFLVFKLTSLTIENYINYTT